MSTRACLLTVALAVTLVIAGSGCRRDDPDVVPHVRLGMAPGDVRDHFEPGGPGAWQTSVGKVADDTAIEWTATSPAAVVRHARFEFHVGMLVAIRATTTARAPDGERIVASSSSVIVRRPGEGGTSIEVFARDCPTHRDEVTALIARVK